MATMEELVYRLRFAYNSNAFNRFRGSLDTSIKNIAKLTAVAGVAGVAIFKLTEKIAGSVDGLNKLAPRLNTTTEAYQKLSFAAEDFGAGSSDVKSSLEGLTSAMAQALRGQGDWYAWGRLGLNPTDYKTSSDLLLAVSDKIGTIQNQAEKLDILKKVGISTNLLQMLESGSKNIRNLGGEFQSLGGVVSKEQQKLAGDFQAKWLRTQTVFHGVMNKLGEGLMKNVNKFLGVFNKFVNLHMQDILHVFNSIFNVLGKIVKFTSVVISNFGGLKNTLLAVAGVFALIKARALASLMAPLAIILILQDVISGLQGKSSYTLDMVNVFKEFFNVLFDLIDIKINQLFTYLEGLINRILNYLGIITQPSLNNFGVYADKNGNSVYADGTYVDSGTKTAPSNQIPTRFNINTKVHVDGKVLGQTLSNNTMFRLGN